jgi:DNA repair protein NreA
MVFVQEIRKNLENNWIQFLNKYAKNISTKSFSGSSPPSVFVGNYGYPKVKVGPMLPPIHGNTTIFDSPEKWLGKSLDEIARYRLSLVRGVSEININNPFGKYIESLQELAMSKLPSESEMVFEKMPIIDIEKEKKFDEASYAPYGLSAPLESFRTSSISVDKRLENSFYDKDLNATESIFNLYKNGAEISDIIRIFSMGMLGVQKNRKLVPTRWSISAIDDIISTELTKKIENHPSIELFEVHNYQHLGNNYSIILIPHGKWFLEMQEAWIDNKGNAVIGIDIEGKGKLNHDPSLAGAFFSARLAVSEYLNKIKKMAAVMILREIHPQYAIPVGVWQVREGIREAFKKDIFEFEDFNKAFLYATSLLSVSKNEWLENSKIYSKIIKQKTILDYL